MGVRIGRRSVKAYRPSPTKKWGHGQIRHAGTRQHLIFTPVVFILVKTR